MRILMVNYEFPPIGGGTGNACYYMLREFSTYDDLSIDLVTFSPDNATRTERFSDNVTIYYVACGKKKSLHFWKMSELMSWLVYTHRFLRRHLRENRYDVTHCWSGWPAGIMGYLFRKHAPYIVALRGSDIPGYSTRTALLDKLVMKRLSRLVWRKAAAITIVSRDAAKLASKTAAIDFEVIHNGVDISQFYPAESATVSYPVRMLYVGRLIPRKGVQDVLRALVLMREEFGDELENRLRFSIVGSGTLEDELKDFVRESGLEKVVDFKGIIKHDDLPAIYRAHDLFILPSHAEAFSNSMQEAIASGLAILSTNTGGAEVLDGNGLIVDSGNAADIGEKLSLLINEDGKLLELKQNSEIVAQSLGWNSCCSRYRQIYGTSLGADHSGVLN